MYFITTKRMLEVCFSVHPNIQYRTNKAIIRRITTKRRLLYYIRNQNTKDYIKISKGYKKLKDRIFKICYTLCKVVFFKVPS